MADTPPAAWSRRAQHLLFKAAHEAVNDTLLEVGGEAQRRAPLDEGTLRGSMTIERAENRGGLISGAILFGTVYAARQHEETTWNHPLGGEAKYLERPLVEDGPRALQRNMAAAMRRQGL